MIAIVAVALLHIPHLVQGSLTKTCLLQQVPVKRMCTNRKHLSWPIKYTPENPIYNWIMQSYPTLKASILKKSKWLQMRDGLRNIIRDVITIRQFIVSSFSSRNNQESYILILLNCRWQSVSLYNLMILLMLSSMEEVMSLK